MTREDELLLLTQGIQSDFWGLIESKFRPLFDKQVRVALSKGQSSRDRDVACERASMLEEVLDWPHERIETLRKLIEDEISSQ